MGPSNQLWEKLIQCMPTTTLRSSLLVGRLTKINSHCCNAINSYHGRPGKPSLISLFFYTIKVATIKSAFVALGNLLNQSTDFSFLLGFLELSSPQPIQQCIAKSFMGLPTAVIFLGDEGAAMMSP